MAAGTGSFAGASSPVFAQMLDCRCSSLAQREKIGTSSGKNSHAHSGVQKED